jgi:hypothetical protein
MHPDKNKSKAPIERADKEVTGPQPLHFINLANGLIAGRQRLESVSLLIIRRFPATYH